jgi:hypothetical protein
MNPRTLKNLIDNISNKMGIKLDTYLVKVDGNVFVVGDNSAIRFQGETTGDYTVWQHMEDSWTPLHIEEFLSLTLERALKVFFQEILNDRLDNYFLNHE